MMGLIIAIHIVACALLITIILIQRGRGGGLLESFSDVESMFGTKTDMFLGRITSILSVLFFITCLSLALLSARQSRSLLQNIKIEQAKEDAIPIEQTKGHPLSQDQQRLADTEKPQEAPKTD